MSDQTHSHNGSTPVVPDAMRGKRLLFLLDPTRAAPPLVIEPGTERQHPLRRAEVRPEDLEQVVEPIRRRYRDAVGGEAEVKV